ncbi:phosphomannomutase/phosphoglucomutase [Candidatus Woesearchaeota archaeon CG10_big_fil_rev_8_21_14_0_10_44_13]|nr:MAG: phosphomannomutase/phosphoglucomutase [Candidatus Woesearchaeota archaeon CG10_big_fil_rev_8_21_14_0_10_44_13]
MRILKKAKFKSYGWADNPVIGENLFREYDLRNPLIPLTKGGKQIEPAINTEGFFVLGQAYGTYVRKVLKKKKMSVGCDYRSYSKGNTYAFITGVLSTGVDVIDIGVVITPMLYFSQYHLKLISAAMITASHNDNGWTGLKLAKGYSKTFGPEDIVGFKKLVYSEKFMKGAGHYSKFEGMDRLYLADIQKTVKPYLKKRKLKVIVSGANGGGSYFIPRLIKSLGFDVIEFECDLDWDFPKFNPNPEDMKFVNAIGEFVRKQGADIGVVVDGDGDRLGVVDEKGNIIFSDRVGLFIARFLVQKMPPAQNIVIDVKSTGAYSIDTILNKYKSRIVFSKTGHSYVKAKSDEIGALAGFEKSGHFFLRQKFGKGYDDACMSAAWFVTILSNNDAPLSEIMSQQPKSYQSPTLEPSTTNDSVKYDIVDEVTEIFRKMKKNGENFAGKRIKELVTINGVRFIFDNGSWGLIRASSNQPVLVITAESFNTRKEMYDIIQAIQGLLSKFDGVGEYDQKMPPYTGEDKQKVTK